MNRSRLLFLMITILWLATAIVTYVFWQDSTNKWLTGHIGQVYLMYDGYPSFFQTPFFALVLIVFINVALLWVGHIYEHLKFSPKYKSLVVIFVGIVFIILGAYLLAYAWTLQQSINSLNGFISKAISPMAPVEDWRQQIDSMQPLLLSSVSNGLIYVAVGVILFFSYKTKVMK